MRKIAETVMDSFAKSKADNKCEIWTDIKKRTLFSLVYRDNSWKYNVLHRH